MMNVLLGRSLRILPLAACVSLVGAAAAHALGTLDATPNPVTLGDDLELTASFAQITANATVVVKYYQFVPTAPTDILIGTVNIPNSGTGINFQETVSVTAAPSLFPDECTYFYAVAVTNQANVFQTDPTLVCRQYGTTTTAQTVSRILPVFKATVAAVAPATGTPTGTVEFYVDGDLVCSGALNGAGQAQCSSLQALLTLEPNYTAVYVGAAPYAASEDDGAFFP